MDKSIGFILLRNKCKQLLIVAILLININAFGQIKLGGKIIDSNTGKPLAYCSVYLIASNNGTVSNIDGEFIINSSNVENDSIVFSYVGYYEKRIKLARLKSTIIKLKQKTFSLTEVEIVASNSIGLAKLIISANRNQKKMYKYSDTQSKSYARVYTYEDDTNLIESFEAFYSTQLNSIVVKTNTLKSGLVLNQQIKLNNFYSLGLITGAIPKINLYKLRTDYRRVRVSEMFSDASAHEDYSNIYNAISPTQLVGYSDIIEIFDLKVKYLDNEYVGISFLNKSDSANFGYIVIDKLENKFLKIIVTTINKDKTIKSINPDFNVKNLKIRTSIIYNEQSHYNVPKYISLNYDFDYYDIINNKSTKKTIKVVQLFYKLNSRFSSCFPGLYSIYNYEKFSLIPVQSRLWHDEMNYVKTKDELSDSKKLERINLNGVLKVNNELVYENYLVNWNRVSHKQLQRKKSYFFDCYIFCDVYYSSSGRQYVNTEAIIDYSKSFYLLSRAAGVERNLADTLFKEIKLATINEAAILKTKLESINKLDEKNVRKEYKKSIRKLDEIYKLIYKDWWIYYEQELRHN